MAPGDRPATDLPGTGESERTPFFAALRDSISAVRDRVVGSPAFHRFVLSNPVTRPVALAQTSALFDVVSGFVYAQTLFAAAELGLFQRLADGPVPHETLARELAVPQDSLAVLLNAAAALGLVERRAAGWGLGLKGAALLVQGGVLEMVAHHKHFYADLADPLALLRRERPTALAAYWTYAAGAKAGSADAEGYTALMAASQAFVSSALLPLAPLRTATHLLDIGGGAGAFASAALGAHPDLKVTVADLPDVVPHAARVFRERGFAQRAETLAFDMFCDPVPSDADVISLVRVLHDHDDGPALELLTRLARERPDALLIVAEPMADRRRPSGLDAYFPWYFQAMGQGHYRTRDALVRLLRQAGYRRVRPLRSRNRLLVRALSASALPN